MNKSKVVLAILACAALAAGGQALSKSSAEGPAIKPGYRALTIPIAGSQLDGIRPGARVDVMVTFKAMTKGGEETVTATILQHIEVLKADAAGGSIQLLLNPNEAQYAALSVSEKTELWVALRGDGDAELKPIEMASFRKLFR